MNEALKRLFAKAGSYQGHGINHEGQKFSALLVLKPQIEGKGSSLEFTATGEDGTIFHKEHSLLAMTAAGTLSLWVLSNNHPGVIEHQYIENQDVQGASTKYSFRYGDVDRANSFREVITLELLENGDVDYRYSWGMPGGEFKERSGARMLAGKNRPIPEAKLKPSKFGLVPDGEGWYVLNAKDACWFSNEKFGESCGFEGNKKFEQYGINLHLIYPGRASCHYHGEDDQENFLIIEGPM